MRDTNMTDFIIENNVLVEYRGKGGEIAVPDGVYVIGEGAFKNCETVTHVKLPKSTVEIRDEAFLDCSNLESVSFSAKNTDIGERAFRCCARLKNLIFFNGADMECFAPVFGFPYEEELASFDVDLGDMNIIDCGLL